MNYNNQNNYQQQFQQPMQPIQTIQPSQNFQDSDNSGFIQIERSNKNRGSAKLILIFIVTIFVSILIGVGGVLLASKFFPNLIGDVNSNVTRTEKEVTVVDNGIADAVEKIYDSVVVVKTYVRNQMYATGTGFVYKKSDDKYYLLTNYHVIKDSDRVSVVFTDGREVNVFVEGGDKYSDIAVLSYQTSDYIQVSSIGSSVDMRVGDTVFAIGAPLDSSVYSWSVTRGVLSGKDREVEVSVSNNNTNDWIMQVLQTDAAINSGNSGGPLCDSNGEVIGVTNMKLVTDGVEGMGFAIPIEDATTYADRIINKEDLSRPYLGVSMIDASVEAYARQYGINPTDGVLVGAVEPGSPASNAGLREGDVVKKMGDTTISNVASLRYELYKYKSGDIVSITYVRSGMTYTTSLTLISK